MKKTLIVIYLLFAQIVTALGQQKPKYIFYMIGDGMGISQIHLTEVYLAAMQGREGVVPLTVSTFPYATFATSYSAAHVVTDSGAGGTALATGYKTKNSVIAMDSAAKKPLKSLAYVAKEAGMKVGIVTSVSLDHATPGAFYANQPNRKYYYEIGSDLPKSNFDFFGGSGFLSKSKNHKKEDVPSLFDKFKEAGYQLAYGLQEYKSFPNKGAKTILINNKNKGYESLKFSIDQKPDDLNLEQITDAAIESVTKNNNKGFFLMIEGGKVDWASHGNDAGTLVQEVLDFDKAIKRAYDFYLKHPDETLIVVTADHETGGLVIGNGKMNLLSNQKVSKGELSKLISKLQKSDKNSSWDDVKAVLKKNLGLFDAVKVSKEDEKALFDIYEKTFVKHQEESVANLYGKDDVLAVEAIKLLNKAVNISWASGGHSAAYVPVYAIGPGAEKFCHKMDNTDIPKKIAHAAMLSLK